MSITPEEFQSSYDAKDWGVEGDSHLMFSEDRCSKNNLLHTLIAIGQGFFLDKTGLVNRSQVLGVGELGKVQPVALLPPAVVKSDRLDLAPFVALHSHKKVLVQ